jgi:hypothetical protein
MQRRREPRCRQEPQVHSARATTPSPEGPRYARGKIARVKHAAVWPAYLVAAVCVAIALISSIANISLIGQTRQQQREVANLTERSTSLARSLSGERTALFDMLDSHAHHYAIGNGEVVTRGSRIDLALHELSEPPRGQVYQVWTRPVGSTKMSPAPTFLPDARGVALVIVPADARATSEVVVTIEPEGGSKEPTTKPLISVAFDSQ